jgi:hypothetical protein
MDIRAAVFGRLELPLVVKIFERPLDIIDTDASRPLLVHFGSKPLLEGVEADHEVGDRLLFRTGADAHRNDPGQEFVVASDVGNKVEQLVGRVR